LRRTAILLLSLVLFTGVSSATVTSVDSITYNSNNEFFNGEVFVIDVASDQSTDKIDIFLGSDVLSESTDGEVQQDLEIDFTDQSTELRYSTRPASELPSIYTYRPHHQDGFESEGDAINAIESQCAELVEQDGSGTGFYRYTYDSFSWEIYCFQKDTYLGTPAYLDNPDEIFSTTAELRASGKTLQSATLSNGDTGSGVITDLGERAKIRWNGNLDTGASEPNVGVVYALHADRYTGSWRIINQDAYGDYKRAIEDQAKEDITEWGQGSQSKWEAVDFYNEEAWDAAKVDTGSDLAYTTVTDTSWGSGQFSYDTEDLLAYPKFTVYVDAGKNGYIEVNKPTGEPSISSASGGDVNEVGGGSVDIIAQNVGDGEGSFSARLTTCSNGFSIRDDQDTEGGVLPGETVSWSFDVGFQSTSSERREVTGSCTVEVQDTGSGVSDSARVSLTGVQESECEPAGKEKYEENSEGIYDIYRCKDNQQGWEFGRSCNEGEKAEYYTEDGVRKAECVEDPEPPCEDCPPPVSWWEKLVDFLTPDNLNGVLGQIHLGLSLIAGVLLSIVGYKGGRWIDDERDVNGSFQPFKRRSIDRVERGRFLVGIIGAVAGLVLGTLLALQVPLGVQVIVVLGAGFLLWKNPFTG